MHITKSRYNFPSKSGNLLLLLFLLIMSCQEWTPQADGYYVIDGKRYNVHIMAIRSYPQYSNSNIELILQGARAYNVLMYVSVPGSILKDGTYQLSYNSLMRINWISILRGNTTEEITSNNNSEGNMTVKVSGLHYVMDFNGKISGHTVQIHYSGLAGNQ